MGAMAVAILKTIINFSVSLPHSRGRPIEIYSEFTILNLNNTISQ